MSTVMEMKATVVRGRPFYVGVAALGFGLITLAGLFALITAMAAGDTGETLTFSLVFAGIGLLVAGAVWTSKTWALILGALLGLAMVGLVGPFSLFTLGHPESAGDFVPMVLLLAGSILGLVGSVVALVQARRRTLRENASGIERLALGALVGVVTLAICLSIVLTLTGRSAIPAEARAGATSLQMKNYQFAPGSLQVKTGDVARAVIRNDDSTLHTFTLPSAGIDVSVPPGTEKLVEFRAPAAGTYRWYCIPHSSDSGAAREGMVGTLQVQ